MVKLVKVVLLLVAMVMLPIIIYANDLHFGTELGLVGNAGFSHSNISHKYTYRGVEYDTDKKYGNYDSNIDKENRIENNRNNLGLYLDVQLGVDIATSNQNLNLTPYVDLGGVTEFSKASPSMMIGLGFMGVMKYASKDDISYLAGVELHRTGLAYIAVIPNHYNYFSGKQETTVSYSGSGAVLAGGILYNQYTFKLLYITNSYKLKKFGTEDAGEKAWLTSQFPDKMLVQSIGLSVGYKF